MFLNLIPLMLVASGHNMMFNCSFDYSQNLLMMHTLKVLSTHASKNLSERNLLLNNLHVIGGGGSAGGNASLGDV